MTSFPGRGRTIPLLTAGLVIIGLGLLSAVQVGRGTYCSDGPVRVTCPADPVGPWGEPVSDTFSFVHRPLGPQGSITVRLTSMTGIITYPPPRHDAIVSGLVPWAKAGIIVKADLRPGSPYVALMRTGAHGVRMQWNYRSGTGPAAGSSQWLRLTRSGGGVTGWTSADGTHWTAVGSARVDLPATAQVGLFTTSPGDVSLRRVALGADIPESRFTQASATFDHVRTAGAGSGAWLSDSIGIQGGTDWEKYHRAPGLTRQGERFTVTGAGDISPGNHDGWQPAGVLLFGVVIGLVIVMVAATRPATRPGVRPGDQAAFGAAARRVGGATFVMGLVATGILLPTGIRLLRSYEIPVLPVPPLTGLRIVVGAAALLALGSVLALAVAAVIRRRWVAALTAIAVLPLPYLLAVQPLFPDPVAGWLLRITPAAGFAVMQTLTAHPGVTAHVAPSSGYFPLPWWAGLAVLGSYATVALLLAHKRPLRWSGGGRGSGGPEPANGRPQRHEDPRGEPAGPGDDRRRGS